MEEVSSFHCRLWLCLSSLCKALPHFRVLSLSFLLFLSFYLLIRTRAHSAYNPAPGLLKIQRIQAILASLNAVISLSIVDSHA